MHPGRCAVNFCGSTALSTPAGGRLRQAAASYPRATEQRRQALPDS